jgi:hypothetical protein
MNVHKLLIPLAILALAGCASTGAHSGAASTIIDGVEVWTGGPPPRPYHVIATVAREAADSSSDFADLERSIAYEARSRGADAVIVLDTVMVISRMDLVGGRPIMAPKVGAELIKYE